MPPYNNQTPQNYRVVLYARVSLEIQAEEGHSIDAQLVEMRAYAQTRKWQIVGEFVDPGYTGTDLKRPGLGALRELVRNHQCDVVLVHELSRLSRRLYDTFELFEEFGKHDVGFASVGDSDFDFSSPTGRLFLTIMAALNQYYVDILKMHTKKGKHQRVRDGLYNASTPPYGYRHVGDQRTPPEIVPEEAAAVRLIFERYATGHYSYQDLADLLNAQGFRTHSDTHFSKDTIADMLRNPFYMGMVVYKQKQRAQDAGEVYAGQHEALISAGLWEACHQVRARHHSASRPFQPQVRPYLLGQLIHCHACGRRLRAQKTPSGRYYREMSGARGFDDCPYARIGTRADPLHQQMSAIVNRLQLPEDWQTEMLELVGEDEEVDALQERRERLEAERRRLKRAWVRGDFQDEDADLYQQELERIRRELACIPAENELAQLQQAAQQVESLQEIWDDAEETDQRDLLQLMLRRVIADVAQGRILLLYPTAPFIPLFRAIPLLHERELGVFTPVWPPEVAAALALPQCKPLVCVPAPAANHPFLPVWPWKNEARSRISPPLSAALKLRSQAGLGGGPAFAVPHAGVPPLLLDTRKWPAVTLEELPLSRVLAQPAGSVLFLDTPLVVQPHPDRPDLVQQVHERLADQGTWHWFDLMPTSMPAHWVFSTFPATWTYIQSGYWNAQQIFTQLKKVGFQVTLQEHTFYQAVRLDVALEIARQRGGILQLLNDAAYCKGLAQLEAQMAEQGPEMLLGSEVALVEVTARKGAPPRQRRHRKSA